MGFLSKERPASRAIDLEQFAPLARTLLSHGFSWGCRDMLDNGIIQRDKFRQELAALKEEVIAKLERRGYDVRGKTPAQIRRALKRRPKKRPNTESSITITIE